MSRGPLTICVVGYARSQHVVTRARSFAERGHRVYLVTEAWNPDGIEGVVQLVPDSARLGLFALALRFLLALLRRLRIETKHLYRAFAFVTLLRRIRPDVVHVHYAYSYYGWMAGMVGCRPLVVTVMGGDILFDEQGSPTPEGEWLTLNLLRQADYITSKSNHLLDVLDQLGGLGTKAERIIWGVALRQFRRVDATALRASLGIEPTSRVVLSPKILQPFYRVHLIVDAMARVIRSVPDAMLLITEYAADAEYRAVLETRIRELGLERHVRFCGHVAYKDMPAYYSLAEMTVAVPSSDGLPQTLLEGMACETPSVLSRLPRYEEIVSHRQSAYFVEPDAGSIAEGIVELYREPALRKDIASRALEIVRAVADLDEQVSRVESKFYELTRTVRAEPWSLARARRAWRGYREFRRTHG